MFITGASGVGKSSLLDELKKKYNHLNCEFLHFDSIGVPSVEDMVKEYGSPSAWQEAMTLKWVHDLVNCHDADRIFFEGQVNLKFIQNAFSHYGFTNYQIVLIDCSEEEIGLMTAVYAALKEAFQLSDDAINVRLFAHEPHRFLIPPTKNKFETYAQPERFVVISIDCFTDRSIDTKRHLYKRIAENLAEYGIPKDHIKIVLRESSRENWGILGAEAGCDVDVGYQVEV